MGSARVTPKTKKHLEALHPEQSEMLVVCGGVLGASFLIKGLSMGLKKKNKRHEVHQPSLIDKALYLNILNPVVYKYINIHVYIIFNG